MKKVMLSCALILSAVVASAIPWTGPAWDTSRSLIIAGKLTEARAYLDTVEPPRSAVEFRAWIDYLDESVDTSTPAKLYAVAEGYYSALGSTGALLKNSSEYAVLRVLWETKEYDNLLEYYNTLENPSGNCVGRAVYALQKLGRADEAIALAVAHKNWYVAFNAANAKRDAVKTFEYGKELLLGREQTAKTVIIVLGAINNYNYADTAITKEMQIDFLKAVDVKYRRFMAIDEVTWKPILAGVLYSLKSLGVTVVE